MRQQAAVGDLSRQKMIAVTSGVALIAAAVSLVILAPPAPRANSIDGASLLLQQQQWSIDVVCGRVRARGPPSRQGTQVT